MATTVKVHRRCQVDVGERTADRRLLIDVGIQALIEMLGRTRGLPVGAILTDINPMPMYTWEDSNWLIGYTRAESRGLIGAPDVVVTIFTITLKGRPN